jgi:hypothetical protein
MGMSLDHGGHLTHGHKVSATGKFWTQVPYGLNKDTELLDYAALKELALREKPAIIVGGYTAYPRIVDFKKLREIADACGAFLMIDMSHVAGLVAGKAYPSPFPYADVVTTTVHKTLRGPRSAIIFAKKDTRELGKKIDKAVFPGLQGGPHLNQIAAVAVALKEGTNVWSSEIKFTNSGEYQIQAEALDGANNKTTSLLAKIQIQKNGAVASNGKPVEGASVKVFFLENDTRTFSEWHAGAYAQSNPLKTDASGGYSFTLPQGTYYVEVTAPGYNRLVSDVFSLEETRALNADLVLREKPHIQIGSLRITIPVGFTDTHAIVLKEQSSAISKSKKENAIGNPIKEFSVVSNGKEITNNYFKGKSTLLVFSNTWLPQTQQAIQALSREKDYQTALVIPHESDSYIQTYKKRGGYDVTFIADKDGVLLENLGINTMPSVVLIDPRGIVKDLRIGVFSMEPKKL